MPILFCQFSSLKGSSFFAINFGFEAILFGVFRPKKTFSIIGEEEDFLDSLFLFGSDKEPYHTRFWSANNKAL